MTKPILMPSSISPAEFEELENRIRPVVNRLSRAVHPMLVMREKRPPQHVGCCVLLAIGEARFLLTAAHVLDEFMDKPIHIAAAGEVRHILGHFKRTLPIKGQRRRTDRIDAGVLRFANEIPELEGSFLALRDVNARDGLMPKGNYMLFGHPASKTRSDRATMRVRSGYFQYAGPNVSPARYSLSDVSPLTHVAIHFDIHRTTYQSGVATAPSPLGASGSGMFWLPFLDDPTRVDDPKLVGIFTDFQRQRQLLLGSRINYHFELIRVGWPEFGSLLPRHGVVDLRVHEVEPHPVEP